MTDQQFCLRWNNHQSTLVAVFDGLLEKGVLVDCTLAAEGQQLTAHKVVLAACSPFLETLLSRHYDKHPILILKDVKFSELKAMMDYMYRGEVNISQDQLGTFLKAAESLQIKGLSDGGGEKDSYPPTKTPRHERKPLRPTSPLRNSMPPSAGAPIPPVPEGKRVNPQPVPVPPPYLHTSIRNSIKSSPLLVDIPEDNTVRRDGSLSPVPRKKKRPRESEELNPLTLNPIALNTLALNNNVVCKTEVEDAGSARPSPQSIAPAPIPPPRVPSPDAKSDTTLDKTDPVAHLKHELIEEEEDINEDSMELTLDEDDGGEAGPSHNDGDFTNDFYGGSQDGDNRDGQGVESPLHHRLFAQVKGEATPGSGQRKRGRPRKECPATKPLGRPRKFIPAIGDPIRFLQSASLQGLFKVNDENAHIAGLSSFLNPNFRAGDLRFDENGGETPENFSCQFCGKTYKKKKHYNRHINFECINTEPRFLCTMCAYRARRKEHLIRHLRSHIGDLLTSGECGVTREDLEPLIGHEDLYSPASKESKEDDAAPMNGVLGTTVHGVLGVRQTFADWPLPPSIKEELHNTVISPPTFSLHQAITE